MISGIEFPLTYSVGMNGWGIHHTVFGYSLDPRSVLEGISKGLEDFYLRVVEDLVPFVPRAPRLVTKEMQTKDGDGSRRERGGEVVLGDPTTAANKPM